jgi:hypothetical protein
MFIGEGEPRHSGKAVALLSRGHGLKSLKQPLAEVQGKAAYIRLKVFGPFSRPCASGSYVHQAAFFGYVYCFMSKGFSELFNC